MSNGLTLIIQLLDKGVLSLPSKETKDNNIFQDGGSNLMVSVWEYSREAILVPASLDCFLNVIFISFFFF